MLGHCLRRWEDGYGSQKTQDIYPMPFQCWPTVFDGWPTLKQHRVNASCLLGYGARPTWPLDETRRPPRTRRSNRRGSGAARQDALCRLDDWGGRGVDDKRAACVNAARFSGPRSGDNHLLCHRLYTAESKLWPLAESPPNLAARQGFSCSTPPPPLQPPSPPHCRYSINSLNFKHVLK